MKNGYRKKNNKKRNRNDSFLFYIMSKVELV